MSAGFKVTISIIITAIIVGGIGYWYMNKQATDDKAALQTQIDSLTNQVVELKKDAVSATTATTTDETASWKTYINDDLGFSFKYPRTFTLTDNLSATGNWTVAKKVTAKDSTDTLDVWVNPDGFGPFFPDITYQTTSSSSGVTVSGKEASSTAEAKNNVTFAKTQFTYGDNSYLVHYNINGTDSEPLSTFDAILSTFQFSK